MIALFDHLRNWSGLREEESGIDIHAVVFLMMRSGLYLTNSYHRKDNSFSIGADTVIAPSPLVITYIIPGMSAADDDGEEN